jgi:thiosulfate/3-mercaptopyruvate sulfurtransferase
MTYNTLISAVELNIHLNDDNWVIFDCRFSLANPEQGASAYRYGHIPQARYVHLDKDLCSAITVFSGRHPLPDFAQLAKKLADWGVNNQTQVVVYDDAGGAFAGRLWWLLQCLGHKNVAVLNGGLPHWLTQGFPLTTVLPTVKPTVFVSCLNDSLWLSARQVEDGLARRRITLLDARTPERYRGEQEPIDPIAGHIPYALNRPFQLNLDRSGLFLAADSLRQQFSLLLGECLATQVVHSCGSGVTACHNVLAMEVAGLKGSKVYAGSWSEWIKDKNRRVVCGASMSG